MMDSFAVISESLVAHVLQLPYLGDTISMFVFLPPYSAPKGVNTILSNMTPVKLRDILSGKVMNQKEVEVGLPKFSVEHTLELAPVSFIMLFNICIFQYSITIVY